MKKLLFILLISICANVGYCQNAVFEEGMSNRVAALSERLMMNGEHIECDKGVDTIKVVFQYILPKGKIESHRGLMVRKWEEEIYDANTSATLVYMSRIRKIYTPVHILEGRYIYQLNSVFSWKEFEWQD